MKVTVDGVEYGPKTDAEVVTTAPLSELVFKARKHERLTLENIAHETGLNVATISMIESGHSLNPRLYTVMKLVACLNIDARRIAVPTAPNKKWKNSVED